MWQQQEIDEYRAIYISDKVYATAHRMYIRDPAAHRQGERSELGTLRARGVRPALPEPQGRRGTRTKIRAEVEARWKQIIRWGGWIVAGATMLTKLF